MTDKGKGRKKKSLLQDLIVSRVRVKMLNLFFNQPSKMYHVRGIVRRIEEEINAVRRELAHLEKVGILKKEKRANRLFYSLRMDYPLYYELMELVAKTNGIGREILNKRAKLGKLKFVMLSGRFVRGKQGGKNDVDILFIGDLVLPEISALVKEEEARKERVIRYAVMTEEEFEFRKSRNDPFIKRILWGSRVMIIGDEEELIA